LHPLHAGVQMEALSLSPRASRSTFSICIDSPSRDEGFLGRRAFLMLRSSFTGNSAPNSGCPRADSRIADGKFATILMSVFANPIQILRNILQCRSQPTVKSSGKLCDQFGQFRNLKEESASLHEQYSYQSEEYWHDLPNCKADDQDYHCPCHPDADCWWQRVIQIVFGRISGKVASFSTKGENAKWSHIRHVRLHEGFAC
jgi:hypothetical protein